MFCLTTNIDDNPIDMSYFETLAEASKESKENPKEGTSFELHSDQWPNHHLEGKLKKLYIDWVKVKD